jgi:TonB family protein
MGSTANCAARNLGRLKAGRPALRLAYDALKAMNSQTMRFVRSTLMPTLACIGLSAVAVGDTTDANGSETLCQALGRTSPGDRHVVTVSGIYTVSYEFAILYDPATPLCEIDVQPDTAVEFDDGLRLEPDLERLLKTDRRAYVVVRGELWGPKPVGDDDISLPPMISYAERTAGRRYGHLNAFRTRLVIKDVLSFQPVEPETPAYGETSTTRPKSALPIVLSAELPQYPPAAQRAGITGTAVVEVRVESGRVAEVTPTQGDRILLAGAVESVKTWTFDPSVDTSFATTFVFQLEPRPSGGNQNSRIESRLPTVIIVTGAANQW